MGAGQFPAGVAPAGADPVFGTGPGGTNHAPAALLFDAGTKDFTLDTATGRYVSVHPVDQQVNMALGIVQGKISSASALGNALKSIKFAGGPKLLNAVNVKVRDALKTLVDAKDVEVGTIAVESLPFGGFVVAVPYRNLRVLTDQQRKTIVPLS